MKDQALTKTNAARLLDTTYKEESETDRKLSELANNGENAKAAA